MQRTGTFGGLPTERDIASRIELGIDRVGEQVGAAAPERVHLFRRQEAAEERLDERAVPDEPFQVGEQVGRNRFAAEVPNDRAQLGVDVEGEPVVDPPQTAIVPATEQVARLTIGVVGEQIEYGDALQLITQIATAQGPLLRFDVELHGPDTVGAVTHDSGRNEGPAQETTKEIARILPPVEGAGWEVPQRRLAPGGLIDADEIRHQILLEHDSERPVGTPRDEFHLDDAPLLQRTEERANVPWTVWRRHPVARRSPIGSMRRHLSKTRCEWEGLRSSLTTIPYTAFWLREVMNEYD